MDEVKIYQKRKKMIKSILLGLYIILLSLLFLAVGIYDRNVPFIILLGFILLVEISCYAVILYHFVKPKAILAVNQKGIIDQSTIPNIGKISWQDIDQIYMTKVFKKDTICIKLKDNDKFYSGLPKWKALFIKLNTPKNTDPVMINLRKTDEDISVVLDLLKTALRDSIRD